MARESEEISSHRRRRSPVHDGDNFSQQNAPDAKRTRTSNEQLSSSNSRNSLREGEKDKKEFLRSDKSDQVHRSSSGRHKGDSGSDQTLLKSATSNREKERPRERDRDRAREKERDRDHDRDRGRERTRDHGRRSDDKEQPKERSIRETDDSDIGRSSRNERHRHRSRSKSRGHRERDHPSSSNHRSQGHDNYERRGRRDQENSDNDDLGRDKGFGYRFGNDRDRYRSPSPPPGTIPLDERPRKLKNWDMPPPGFEHLTVQQVKTNGMFPLPSHIASSKLDPSFQMQSDPRGRTLQPQLGSTMHTAAFTRQQRRLYVGGLPSDINDADLLSFFNSELVRCGFNPTASTAIFGGDRTFSFIELREPSDATNAMSLDGIIFRGNHLKVRRPKDYVPPPGEVSAHSNMHRIPSEIASVGTIMHPANPDKLFIGGIPHNLSDEQIKELLQSFGELRAFSLIKDTFSGVSKGYAFCEFVDHTVADVAIEGLHMMEIGDRRLVVQRASSNSRPVQQPVLQGQPQAATAAGQVSLIPVQSIAGGIGEPTKVLSLLNLGPAEILKSESDLEDMLMDVNEECARFGSVTDIFIPKQPDDFTCPPVVQVIIEFETANDCQNACRHVAGRTYAGRTVIAYYFPEDRWNKKDFFGLVNEIMV